MDELTKLSKSNCSDGDQSVESVYASSIGHLIKVRIESMFPERHRDRQTDRQRQTDRETNRPRLDELT